MKVLKFSAGFCQPCKQMSKLIESMKDEITIQIDEIDAEQSPDLVKQYGVRNIPTLVMLDDTGVEIKRSVGSLNRDGLLKFLEV